MVTSPWNNYFCNFYFYKFMDYNECKEPKYIDEEKLRGGGGVQAR